MTRDQLQEFFREKKEKAQPTGVNWAAKRDAWILAVNDLYRRIEDDYLRSARGDVEISHADNVVTENFIGQYRIRDLILRVGDEEVVFSPKGTNIVGPAKGRIDVRGDRGEATLLWLGDRWSIVASRTPALRLIPLDAETLGEMLKVVMRP